MIGFRIILFLWFDGLLIRGVFILECSRISCCLFRIRIIVLVRGGLGSLGLLFGIGLSSLYLSIDGNLNILVNLLSFQKIILILLDLSTTSTL